MFWFCIALLLFPMYVITHFFKLLQCQLDSNKNHFSRKSNIKTQNSIKKMFAQFIYFNLNTTYLCVINIPW